MVGCGVGMGEEVWSFCLIRRLLVSGWRAVGVRIVESLLG